MPELGQWYSREEMAARVQLLNRIYDEAFQWSHRRAQKEHVDLFGQPIRTGETYWRMTMGGGYANDIKMSEASMERFLYAVFAPSPNWEMEVVAKQQKEMQSIRQMMDQLRGSG